MMMMMVMVMMMMMMMVSVISLAIVVTAVGNDCDLCDGRAAACISCTMRNQVALKCIRDIEGWKLFSSTFVNEHRLHTLTTTCSSRQQ
jgi:hypothetical protein